MPRNSDPGWDWFETSDSGAVEDASPDLAACYARCFRGADGERVLAHLKAATLGRVLGPSCTDAELRDAEGRRGLVATILALVERGRTPGVPL